MNDKFSKITEEKTTKRTKINPEKRRYTTFFPMNIIIIDCCWKHFLNVKIVFLITSLPHQNSTNSVWEFFFCCDEKNPFPRKSNHITWVSLCVWKLCWFFFSIFTEFFLLFFFLLPKWKQTIFHSSFVKSSSWLWLWSIRFIMNNHKILGLFSW